MTIFLIKDIKCHHNNSSVIDLADGMNSTLIDKNAITSVKIDLNKYAL